MGIVFASICAVVASLPAVNPMGVREETTMLQLRQHDEPVKVVDPTASPTSALPTTTVSPTPTPSVVPTSAAPTPYPTLGPTSPTPSNHPTASNSGQMVYDTKSTIAPGQTQAPSGTKDRKCLCTSGDWIDLFPLKSPLTGSCESLLDKNQSSCDAMKTAMGGSLQAYQSMCCFHNAQKAPSGEIKLGETK